MADRYEINLIKLYSLLKMENGYNNNGINKCKNVKDFVINLIMLSEIAIIFMN